MCNALVVAPGGNVCPEHIEAMRSCAVNVTVTSRRGRNRYIHGHPKGTYSKEVWYTRGEILVFCPPAVGVENPLTEATPTARLSRRGLSLDELGLCVSTGRQSW
jgi:hypothetical protein